MTESETREIEELRKTLSVSYWGEDCHIDWEETARENYQQGIRKIPDGAVVLTADEFAEYETNYDKVYEQAKTDIVGNMADGGTSCHWCMDAQYQRGRKETAREILQVLLQYGDRDEALRRHILDIADEFDVEVDE